MGINIDLYSRTLGNAASGKGYYDEVFVLHM